MALCYLFLKLTLLLISSIVLILLTLFEEKIDDRESVSLNKDNEDSSSWGPLASLRSLSPVLNVLNLFFQKFLGFRFC